jgi:hypothetical protein
LRRVPYVDSDATPPVEGNSCYQVGRCAKPGSVPAESEVERKLRRAVEGLAPRLVPLAGTLVRSLTRDMATGGWIFGRHKAIDELDLARDSLHSNADGSWFFGDKNLADGVERLRILGKPGAAGFGVVEYFEQ